jgi:hypothetical protein
MMCAFSDFPLGNYMLAVIFEGSGMMVANPDLYRITLH